MEVFFKTTKVKRPAEYYWGKLKIALKYLKLTKHMNLTLRFDSLLVVNWWKYASYNTLDCCCGHTECTTIL